jgi:hypothetical protein
MHPSITSQSTTFYEQIKNCKDLDLRDERGKKHPLPIILIGVMIAILRNRDGVLSSIHRSMKSTYGTLCIHLQEDTQRVVSRAQLPLILKK